MMPPDRRWCPRWTAHKNVHTTVTPDGGGPTEGTAIDISRGGAYVGHARTRAGKAAVRFEIDDPVSRIRMPVERKCAVLPERSGDAGGFALKFDTPLSSGEVALFATPADACGSLDLAREDYRIVNGEVIGIQACRSQLFLGTLAGISAWMIAAIGIGVTNNLASPAWIGIGVSFPYLLLTMAILATMEKANAINMRKGFLAALSDYLRADQAPPNYIGWAHLKVMRSECRSRREGQLCPDAGNYCWASSQERAWRVTNRHHDVSNVFDSFMALVSLVYGVLYGAATVLLLGLGYYYSALYPKAWPAIVAADVLLGASIALVTVFLMSRIRWLRKGRKSVEAYYFQWLAILRYCRSIQGLEIAAPQVSRASHGTPPAASAPAERPRNAPEGGGVGAESPLAPSGAG